jgi:hypothetical protein
MDCLRSFSFTSTANENSVSPEIKTWVVGTNNYWLYQSTNPDSTFNVEGFKNINLYGISAVGYVSSNVTAPIGTNAIVQDWSFIIQIIGQNAVTNGNITVSPNGFSIISEDTNPNFVLSKFTPTINFKTPIQSAKQIIIKGFEALGTGAENVANINLSWGVTFNIFYKFEGE